MLPIEGNSLRKAIRAGKLGDVDSEKVYKGPVGPISAHSCEAFLNAIRSRLDEQFTDVELRNTENDSDYLQVFVLSEQQAEQDFGEEAAEVETSERLHSFIQRATGNVFLALPDESGPSLSYGPRCNVGDPKSFDHALNQKGIMLPFQGGARILLELGVDVDSTNSWGETSLMYACSLLNKTLINWLLSHGANPNKRCIGSKATALHRLVEANGSDEDKSTVVKSLVSKGADVHVRNAWGTTPLHLAVMANQTHTSDALIAAGARLSDKDNDNRTPNDMVLS